MLEGPVAKSLLLLARKDRMVIGGAGLPIVPPKKDVVAIRRGQFPIFTHAHALGKGPNWAHANARVKCKAFLGRHDQHLKAHFV